MESVLEGSRGISLDIIVVIFMRKDEGLKLCDSRDDRKKRII